MGLESATYISELNTSNPGSSDPRSEGDDHLRLIKSTVKATFPNIAGAMTASHTELNYSVGVTSAIQTQLTAKAANGANSDITSLSGLTTPLSASQGGSGQATAAAAAQAYLAAIGATQGNLLYYNGTAWVALAKGTAGQVLKMNSEATIPEWSVSSAWVSSGELAVPASGVALEWAHGLGAAPLNFEAYLKCVDASGDINWPQGTIIKLATEEWATGGYDTYRAVYANITNVGFRYYQAIALCRNSSSSYENIITPSKWRVIFRASL